MSLCRDCAVSLYGSTEGLKSKIVQLDMEPTCDNCARRTDGEVVYKEPRP